MSAVQWQSFFRIRVHSLLILAYAFAVPWSRTNSPTVLSRRDIDGWAVNSLPLSALRFTLIRKRALCHYEYDCCISKLNLISCFQLISLFHSLFNYSHFFFSFLSYCLHFHIILYCDVTIHADVGKVTEDWPFGDVFFFSNFSTPVFKMWVIQKPNKVALWNKRHFEEEKMEIIQHV